MWWCLSCRPARGHLRIEYSGPMSDFLSWWDGVELWLSGLPFVAQTAVVMPVVLALAYGVAVVLDGALGNGIRVLRRGRPEGENVDPRALGPGRAPPPP